VVDDFAPFREFVDSTLSKGSEFRIVGEAADGLEAVQKAEELHPDLILLDIGLPKLNGIEAARRIRKIAPNSKIIFVSQESSADVVQEAFSLGAMGYVVKAHAGTELLAALNKVHQGEHFVSARLSGHIFTFSANSPTPASCKQEALAAPPRRNEEITRSHKVQFYSDDASLLYGFTRFIKTALLAGNAAIVVATKAHREIHFQRLQAEDSNFGTVVQQGRYLPVDVAETLATFMVDGVVDAARFRKVAGELVDTATRAALGEHRCVAACGECAPSLWAKGNANAAVELERLWDEIARERNVDILCGYVLNDFQREWEHHVYNRICAEHSGVCLG
jgi:DNA-binding NarL/FixJ family response regulator